MTFLSLSLPLKELLKRFGSHCLHYSFVSLMLCCAAGFFNSSRASSVKRMSKAASKPVLNEEDRAWRRLEGSNVTGDAEL
jgi:hypothetical protein